MGERTTSPAETLRSAAKLMRERAEAATPGPWERPLDVRNKDIVMAARPEDEQPRTWEGGIIPASFADHKGPTGRYAGQRERVSVVQCNTWSDGTHDRKRNGRDLEYIAAMHPGVGLALADLLDRIAWMVEMDADLAGRVGVDETLAVARAFLREADDV
jgi:hypothetical protein